MNPNVIENLGILADHAEREADRVEAEMWHPSNGNIQRSAPWVFRQRAARYRAAQAEMLEFKPYPFANVLNPRPSKALAWTANLALAAAILTLLYLLAVSL